MLLLYDLRTLCNMSFINYEPRLVLNSCRDSPLITPEGVVSGRNLFRLLIRHGSLQYTLAVRIIRIVYLVYFSYRRDILCSWTNLTRFARCLMQIFVWCCMNHFFCLFWGLLMNWLWFLMQIVRYYTNLLVLVTLCRWEHIIVSVAHWSEMPAWVLAWVYIILLWFWLKVSLFHSVTVRQIRSLSET